MADPEINVLELHIGKLTLGDGDLVVLKPAEVLSDAHKDYLRATLKAAVDTVNPRANVMILAPDMELSVLTRAEIEAKAE